MIWVLHVHAALPLQGTNMPWPSVWWKLMKLLCLGSGWQLRFRQAAKTGRCAWWPGAKLTRPPRPPESDAVLSSFTFQKWLLQGFIRDFFIFNFPCKAMLAGPPFRDVVFTNEKLKPNWGYFEKSFCHCESLAAGGAARAMVVLPRSCFTHESHKTPALLGQQILAHQRLMEVTSG